MDSNKIVSALMSSFVEQVTKQVLESMVTQFEALRDRMQRLEDSHRQLGRIKRALRDMIDNGDIVVNLDTV